MKKFVSLFLTILFVLSALPTVFAKTTENQQSINSFEALLNGDFESAGDGWILSSDAGTIQSVTEGVYSGEKALRLSSKKSFSVSQTFPVEVGDNLLFKVYSKSESYSSSSAYTFVSLDFWGDDKKISGKPLNKRVKISDEWTEFYIELVAPEKSEYAVVTLGTSGGNILFDKATVLKIPSTIAYTKPDISPLEPENNLVLNPGFETVTDSVVENWEPFNPSKFGQWGENQYTSIATDIVKSGTNSMHLQGIGGQYPSITQKFTNLEPMATYKFTAYVYSSVSVFFKSNLVYCDESGKTLKSQTNLITDPSKNPLNVWHKMTVYFTVADVENTAYIQLNLNSTGNCDIYVDDLSFYKVEEAQASIIETDEWFYYTEWEGGSADITVLDKIVSENPEGTAKVYIKHRDKDKVLAEKVYSPIPQKIDYTFKTSDLSPEYGDVFYVYTDFYDKDGNFIDSNREFFSYYSRPENLSADGKWVDNDGKPMEIVIGNYGQAEENVKYASKSGINIVTIGYSRNPEKLLAELDMCEKYGIMAIVHLYSNSNACGLYPFDTIKAVEAVKNHPATFGYAVQDEPKWTGNPFPGLRISYQLIRDIDRKHPVYYVESCIPFSEDQLKVADFLCVDVYCADRAPYASYVAPYMLKLAEAKALNHNKPTAGLIQTYEWCDYYPTVDEARHMTYQVMFAGVDTAGYYHLDGVLEDETFADGFAKFNLEELPLIYRLFRSGECKVIAKDNSSASQIWYYVWQDGKKTYIGAINRDVTMAHTSQFTGLTKPYKLTRVFGDTTDSNILFSGNDVILNIAPGACVLYEYEQKSFPHTESFTQNGYTEENAVWQDKSGTEYSHPLHIPKGWKWEVTDKNDSLSQAKNTDADHQRATMYTASDDVTYLAMAGADLALSKMVDIIPGYNYSLTTDVYALSQDTTTSLTYEFYHKKQDGTYLKINDYLEEKLANTLDKTSETVLFNTQQAQDVTFDKKQAKKSTLAIDFGITEPSVNAIKISLGGFSQNSDYKDFRAYHNGFILSQGVACELIQNTTYFMEEGFTEGAYSLISATWSDAEDNEYEHPLHLPTGWGWHVTTGETGQYWQAASITTARQRSVMYTASDNKTYLGMSGTDCAITKMVDIVPGYYYTLSTNAYTHAADSRTGLSYWFYHKNEDGTYTEINEYLKSQNKPVLEKTHAYLIGYVGKNGTEVTWNGKSAKTLSLSLGLIASNPEINAVKIGLGGYGGNSDHGNFRVYHDGFKISQVDKLNVPEYPDDEPPALTLGEKDGLPIIRYVPTGEETDFILAVALYTKKSDGTLCLEKVSITKPQPTAKGYYEADIPAKDNKNQIIKAFAWNNKNKIPFTHAITID